MKRLLWSGLTCLVTSASLISDVWLSGNQDRADKESIRDRLVGAWRLASLEEQGADGQLHKVDYTGMIVYTRDGHMSVQIMARDPKAAPPAGPVQYELGGYEGYYGRYDIDERAHSVTHHVEGALVRTLIGNDLTRVYDFSCNQPTLNAIYPLSLHAALPIRLCPPRLDPASGQV